jgi:quercetin dioxygenase-like cupin family protein
MFHARYAAALVALALSPIAAAAGEAVVTNLMTKELPDLGNKEARMLLVEYTPGGTDRPHRHDAHAFIYVLEGSIEMQLAGGEKVTLTEGQTFYEGPNDVHTVGRNASATAPAKFVVVFVKDKGAEILRPVADAEAGSGAGAGH